MPSRWPAISISRFHIGRYTAHSAGYLYCMQRKDPQQCIHGAVSPQAGSRKHPWWNENDHLIYEQRLPRKWHQWKPGEPIPANGILQRAGWKGIALIDQDKGICVMTWIVYIYRKKQRLSIPVGKMIAIAAMILVRGRRGKITQGWLVTVSQDDRPMPACVNTGRSFQLYTISSTSGIDAVFIRYILSAP